GGVGRTRRTGPGVDSAVGSRAGPGTAVGAPRRPTTGAGAGIEPDGFGGGALGAAGGTAGTDRRAPVPGGGLGIGAGAPGRRRPGAEWSTTTVWPVRPSASEPAPAIRVAAARPARVAPSEWPRSAQGSCGASRW